MKTMIKAVALLMGVAILGGCVSNQGGNVYSRDEVRQAQTVNMGTITSLRAVNIEGTKSFVGAGAGAVLGGVAGSAIGGGKGRYLTAIAGAVGGGVLGSMAEEGITSANGVEITVREDAGYTRAYVQEVDNNQLFRVGDRVRIMTSRGTSRVSL